MTATTSSEIPLVDVRPWFEGSDAERAALAAQVDADLQRVGFLVVTGHGVPTDLPDRVRAAGHRFFGLPDEAKDRYRAHVGGRGWLAVGAEANAYAEGGESPPDLKESFVVGSEGPVPDGPDAALFAPNVWPDEDPELRVLVEDYCTRMRALADELLALCAVALGEDEAFFARHTTGPSWAFQLNWYPSRETTGEPLPGQFRIGPHTDFGTLTLLDRQPGSGGLQVDIADVGWVDAPHVPGALVVNTGDLLARWSGDRWRSNRHRVLPPPADAPGEELMSLIYFYEADPGAIIEPLAPPRGRTAGLPSVRAGQFLRDKYDAITVA